MPPNNKVLATGNDTVRRARSPFNPKQGSSLTLNSDSLPHVSTRDSARVRCLVLLQDPIPHWTIHLHRLPLAFLHLHLRPFPLPRSNLLFPIFLIVLITPLILLRPALPNLQRNLADEIQPEDVDRLQARQQQKGDALADPAFILLSIPVELKRADGGEGSGDAVEDDDVDVMAEIDPHGDEGGEIGGYDAKIQVREGF